MKLLWADDQPDQARTFAGALTDHGHEIAFVTSGSAALDAIRDATPDLILVDLAMPPGDWGGLWLLERLAELPDAPPALVVSGEGTQRETIQAMRLGAADYVNKDEIGELVA